MFALPIVTNFALQLFGGSIDVLHGRLHALDLFQRPLAGKRRRGSHTSQITHKRSDITVNKIILNRDCFQFFSFRFFFLRIRIRISKIILFPNGSETSFRIDRHIATSILVLQKKKLLAPKKKNSSFFLTSMSFDPKVKFNVLLPPTWFKQIKNS